MLSEETKKQLIKDAGTYKIVASVLTNSRELTVQDIAGVPWTAKQTVQYDLNQ